MLKKAKDEHIIRYFLALGDEYSGKRDEKPEDQENTREKIKKERSSFIFGISFLSRFLHELFFFYNVPNPDDPKDFLDGIHKPIGIHFGPKYKNLPDPETLHDQIEKDRVLALLNDLKAIRFLLKAAAQPPFLRVFDEETNTKYDQRPWSADKKCCVHLMVTDIIQLLPTDQNLRKLLKGITEHRKNSYAANGVCIRIPLKRLFVLPNEANPCCPMNMAHMAQSQTSKSTGKESLVIIMGGAEQNYSIQTLVSMQSWQDPTLRYQFYENPFRRQDVEFLLSTENLVHSMYRYQTSKFDNPRIEMTATGKAKIRAHVYSIDTATTDLLGIYGYNARATKIVAMCIVYFLTDSVASASAAIFHTNTNTLMTADDFRSNLFKNRPLLITVQAGPGQDMKRILDIWDGDDIINQHGKFPAFFEMLQFEVLTV